MTIDYESSSTYLIVLINRTKFIYIDETMEVDLRSLLHSTMLFSCMFFLGSETYAQNPELAKDFADEGISDQAKIEFIKVLHDPNRKSSYDLAEYYLGYIDFKEQKFDLALRHWKTLQEKYPSSSYAPKVKDLINSAYQQLSRQQNLTAQDMEINMLLEDANFLIDRPLKVTVDTSYLPKDLMAIEWLEKIVKEHPGSPEASKALFRELLVYYGWSKAGIGSYSAAEGFGFEFELYISRNHSRANEYINKMIEISNRLQQDFKDSHYRIPTAFLIGQAYWALAGGKLDDNSRFYWNQVLSLTADDGTSDYRQLAEWRLRMGR